MFRVMKMYSPNAGGHTLEIVLGIIGAFFLLLSIICLCVSGISDGFGLFFLCAWLHGTFCL